MSKQIRRQSISYFLMASLLLSFWICVDNCQAEVESDCETVHSISQNTGVENSEKDFCPVQFAPTAFFSNQPLIVSTSASLNPTDFRRTISQLKFAPIAIRQTQITFAKLPLQILHQLRI